jgi:hypothetical protein
MYKSNAFYIGETGQMISKYMNGHRYLSKSAAFSGMLICSCHTPRLHHAMYTANMKWHTNFYFNSDSFPILTSIILTQLPPIPLPFSHSPLAVPWLKAPVCLFVLDCLLSATGCRHKPGKYSSFLPFLTNI